MQIRESAEDYLEAILVLSRKGGGVRSVACSGYPSQVLVMQ